MLTMMHSPERECLLLDESIGGSDPTEDVKFMRGLCKDLTFQGQWEALNEFIETAFKDVSL